MKDKEKKKLVRETLSERLRLLHFILPHPSPRRLTRPRELSREQARGGKRKQRGRGFGPETPKLSRHIIKAAPRVHISAKSNNGTAPRRPRRRRGRGQASPASHRAESGPAYWAFGAFKRRRKGPNSVKTDLFIESNLFIKIDSAMNPRIYDEEKNLKAPTRFQTVPNQDERERNDDITGAFGRFGANIRNIDAKRSFIIF